MRRVSVCAIVLTGCTAACEQQFLLVANPGTQMSLRGSEPVSRVPAATIDGTSPHAFDDPAVHFPSGTDFPYWREGDWVASTGPLHVNVGPETTAVEFVIHPGHRNVPLALEVDSSGICDLRTRARPPRDVGYFVMAASAILLGTSVIARPWMKDERGAVYAGAGALVGFGVGATLALWPAGAGASVVHRDCRP